MENNSPLTAVILAAGRGARLGHVNKALYCAPDQPTHPLLERVVTAAQANGVTTTVVVIGPPFGQATIAALGRTTWGQHLQYAWNQSPERGMGSSVACGFAKLIEASNPANAALLWPVDHVFASPDSLQALRAAAASDQWLIPRVQGRHGHPVVIGRAYWAALAQAGELAHGARDVRDAPSTKLTFLNLTDAGLLRDIDVESDHAVPV